MLLKKILKVSRSTRKPVAKDGYKSKWKPRAKRRANKKVKQAKDVADGGAYKKVSNSWDICDFKFELDDTPKNRRK